MIDQKLKKVKRKSLGWKSPYEVATEMFGKEPFNLLGIVKIDSKDIILNQNLFRK